MSAPDISTADWLALRRQSIGASEAAAACGEDANVSPLELVCRKRGEVPEPDLSEVEAVQWGHILEPVIVGETARRAKLHLVGRAWLDSVFADDADTELVGFVEGRHPFLRSRARPWQTATPDGIGHDPASDLYVSLEAKNAGQYHSAAWDAEDGRAPEKFQIQVAHQLGVAPRLASGILSGLVGGNNLRTVRFDRDKIAQVIDAVMTIESRVWGHVRDGTTPDLTGPPASVARVLNALHPDDNGERILLPAEMVDVAARFEDAKAKEKEFRELAGSLKLELAAAMGKASYGDLPNGAGSYSYLTIEKAGYQVGPQKYRMMLLRKSDAPRKRRSRR